MGLLPQSFKDEHGRTWTQQYAVAPDPDNGQKAGYVLYTTRIGLDPWCHLGVEIRGWKSVYSIGFRFGDDSSFYKHHRTFWRIGRQYSASIEDTKGEIITGLSGNVWKAYDLFEAPPIKRIHDSLEGWFQAAWLLTMYWPEEWKQKAWPRMLAQMQEHDAMEQPSSPPPDDHWSSHFE